MRDSLNDTFAKPSVFPRVFAAWCGLLLISVSRVTAVEQAGFLLRDFLNHRWQNECVRFPLSQSQFEDARTGKALVGPEGKPVSYQLVTPSSDDGPARIAFLADLNPFEKREYRFAETRQSATTDLKVEESADLIRLSNDQTGISIRKSISKTDAPFAGIRLTPDHWVGGSHFSTSQTLTSYSADITARGPVYAEVVCEAVFGEGKVWKATFRLQAGEPVVLVDEIFTLGDRSMWAVSLGPEFPVNHLFYRNQEGGRVTFAELTDLKGFPPGYVFRWRPWALWTGNYHGKWFGLTSNRNDSLLFFAARDSDVWVDPASRIDASTTIIRKDDRTSFGWPLRKGRRNWMVGVLRKDDCLAILKEQNLNQAPLPQRYVIKYEFPLDTVKDYVLSWPAKEAHPRLFISKADLNAVAATFQPPSARALANMIGNPIQITQLDDVIPLYLGTGNKQLEARLVDTATAWLQKSVDTFLQQEKIPSFGAMPHHLANSFLPAINLFDALLSRSCLSEEQLERCRAQIAFMGYTLSRSDYWSPRRGYSANPNMNTTVAGMRTAAACLISSHPRSRQWAESGLYEARRQLKGWSDDNGGWLEAPHYAMVSLDSLLGIFLMTHRSGLGNDIFAPRLKLVADWLAKISTPPDSRINGWRHLPPIGNTYISEPSGEFGILACLWRKRDPQFAARMEWMFHQQGSRRDPGVGGFYPTLAGYRSILRSLSMDRNAIASKPSAFGSEVFPETGVVLRNKYPSERETMLYLIAGKHREHYDFDSGSITIWGKGRIIADDFGYYTRAPEEDASMVESAISKRGMRIQRFATTRELDYVRGITSMGNQTWQREIVFVKDNDSLAPNYFLVCDTLINLGPATWRLWLTCNFVKLNGQGAIVEGKEDVDTDIQFTLPTDIQLKTEQKTRTSTSGLRSDLKSGPIDTTQTGLIATGKDALVLTCLIYPRLKSEKPPSITAIADGKGVKIQSDAGTDYAFLSSTRFTYREKSVAFAGTAGAIKLRGNRTILSLGAAGSLSANGHTLASRKPINKVFRPVRNSSAREQ
ncbi:MAG TPA: hypothetical protein VIS99_11985 [Terrimicrobiaceae bacterium]